MEREPPNMSILQKKKTLGEEKKTTPHPKLLIVKFFCWTRWSWSFPIFFTCHPPLISPSQVLHQTLLRHIGSNYNCTFT
jgi:hypothetical protein